MNSTLAIHLSEKKTPNFHITEYNAPPAFTTIDIILENGPNVKFFVDGPEDVVAFKNNLLWAFERYLKDRAL